MQHYRTPNSPPAQRQPSPFLHQEMGKLPPQALDAEEAVLGALLTEADTAWPLVEGTLKPESFYKESHQRIFEAIQYLSGRFEPVDMLTVTQQLRKMGQLELVGGHGAIADLTAKVGTAANIETHTRIILEMALKRGLITFSSTILRDGYEDTTDAFELLDRAETGILGLTGNISQIADIPFAQQLLETYRHGEAMAMSDKLPGVASAFHALNPMLGGYCPGKLILVGARPSMGKSMFLINEAIPMAYAGEAVAVFTMEMSYKEQNERIISLVTGIDHDEIKFGHAYRNPQKALLIQNKVMELGSLRFYQYAQPSVNLSGLRTKLKKLKAEGNLTAAFIDYIGLMELEGGKNQNKADALGDLSRGLKKLAGELGIPITALVQLSRGVESRGGDKQPDMSDMRDSGRLEEDADVCMFLYRPEYYNITQDENGISTKGLLKLLVRKNRGGQLGEVDLTFQPRISSIINRQSELLERAQIGDVRALQKYPDAAVAAGFLTRTDPNDETPF